MEKQLKFKVGDRVRFTYKCPNGWFFGPTKEFKTGVVKNVRPGSAMFPYTVDVDGRDDYGFCGEQHIELIEDNDGGEYILIANIAGKLAPATTPRTYSSLKQAKRVAHEMAEKNGGVFIVFKAVGRCIGVQTTSYTDL